MGARTKLIAQIFDRGLDKIIGSWLLQCAAEGYIQRFIWLLRKRENILHKQVVGTRQQTLIRKEIYLDVLRIAHLEMNLDSSTNLDLGNDSKLIQRRRIRNRITFRRKKSNSFGGEACLASNVLTNVTTRRLIRLERMRTCINISNNNFNMEL